MMSGARHASAWTRFGLRLNLLLAAGSWVLFTLALGRQHDWTPMVVPPVMTAGAVTQFLLYRRIYGSQPARRRPDYALIAEMEREIYGEAFRHDGAPGAVVVAIPGPCFCSGTADGRHAAGCPAGPGKRGAREPAWCPQGHPVAIYHSAAEGRVFCARCEALRYLKPPETVQVQVMPLPQFWLEPGTATAPPGCLCAWKTRSDGYIVISVPSYHGNALPLPRRCPVPGHDPGGA